MVQPLSVPPLPTLDALREAVQPLAGQQANIRAAVTGGVSVRDLQTLAGVVLGLIEHVEALQAVASPATTNQPEKGLEAMPVQEIQVAIVAETTTAIDHTGHGIQLPAGAYEFVDIDGAEDRGVGYVIGPDRALVCIELSDPAITFE